MSSTTSDLHESDRAYRRLRSVAPLLSHTDLSRYRLTVNFHPDREWRPGGSVLDGMLSSGRYRNQFEVGISNGSPTAFPGGRRERRESVMFGGVYDDAPASCRPIYGAVDLFNRETGGWPRFGSSHLVLRPEVLERCTFAVGDGLSSRSWVGSQAALEVLLRRALHQPPERKAPRRWWSIDGVIELQVHGQVRMDRDVAALVVDPSFRGSRIDKVAHAIARRWGITCTWGPAVVSNPRRWRVSEARPAARALIAGAAFADERCTAADIGRVLHDDAPNTRSAIGTDPVLRDNIAKFLWNRTLLDRDVTSYLGLAHAGTTG